MYVCGCLSVSISVSLRVVLYKYDDDDVCCQYGDNDYCYYGLLLVCFKICVISVMFSMI